MRRSGRLSNLFDRSVRATSAPIAVEKLQPHNWTALRKVIPGSAGLPTVRRRPRFVPARSCSEQAVEMVYRHLSDRIHSASRLIVTPSATGRFPRTRGPRSRERSRYASPPFGLRSLTQTWRALAPTFPRVGVRVMFGSCPPTSYPPTRTSSSASRVDVARGRAPIASPGSPPNTARKSR